MMVCLINCVTHSHLDQVKGHKSIHQPFGRLEETGKPGGNPHGHGERIKVHKYSNSSAGSNWDPGALGLVKIYQKKSDIHAV